MNHFIMSRNIYIIPNPIWQTKNLIETPLWIQVKPIAILQSGVSSSLIRKPLDFSQLMCAPTGVKYISKAELKASNVSGVASKKTVMVYSNFGGWSTSEVFYCNDSSPTYAANA